MADLTFYNAKHGYDLNFAVQRANDYISQMADRNHTCMSEITNELDIGDTSVGKMTHIHELIGQVMFSSGYFCKIETTHIKDGKHKLCAIIKKMSAEEKADCLSYPTGHAPSDTSGDPQAMD